MDNWTGMNTPTIYLVHSISRVQFKYAFVRKKLATWLWGFASSTQSQHHKTFAYKVTQSSQKVAHEAFASTFTLFTNHVTKLTCIRIRICVGSCFVSYCTNQLWVLCSSLHEAHKGVVNTHCSRHFVKGLRVVRYLFLTTTVQEMAKRRLWYIILWSLWSTLARNFDSWQELVKFKHILWLAGLWKVFSVWIICFPICTAHAFGISWRVLTVLIKTTTIIPGNCNHSYKASQHWCPSSVGYRQGLPHHWGSPTYPWAVQQHRLSLWS